MREITALPRNAPAAAPRDFREPAAPGKPAFFQKLDRWTADRRLLLAAMLGAAFLLRCANLGDWNLEVDDQYFALVGHRILAGDVLYVDIFDRKGPALYLLFAACAAVWDSVITYQLVGTVCVGLAAYGIARIAALSAGPLGGFVAGLVYCALMVFFGGGNGQTPVFYNPLMIACAWAIVTRLDVLRSGHVDLRLSMGFAAAGLAIAFKMSAAIEGLFFGLVAVMLFCKAGAPWSRILANAAILGLLGLLPLLLTAIWFVSAGYHNEAWQALVTSNFDRGYVSDAERLDRTARFLTQLTVPVVFALFGLLSLSRRRQLDDRTAFVAAWALVAILAVMAFPVYYSHYAMTVLAPLCILGAGAFRHVVWGLPATIAASGGLVWFGGEIDPASRVQSRAESAALVRYVRQEIPNRRLLVWGFPTYLYVLTGTKPPSVLAFPPHLFDRLEANSSGRDVELDVAAMLADRPEAVVVQRPLPTVTPNRAAIELVERYLNTCGRSRQFTLRDHLGPQTHVVYSRCSGA